jgi:hypothetical protein
MIVRGRETRPHRRGRHAAQGLIEGQHLAFKGPPQPGRLQGGDQALPGFIEGDVVKIDLALGHGIYYIPLLGRASQIVNCPGFATELRAQAAACFWVDVFAFRDEVEEPSARRSDL